MSKALSRARLGVYGLGIATALAFGGTQAFAKLPECTDPRAVSACGSNTGCSNTCQQLGNPDGGVCRNYCCYCLL